jgi:hypothetical protein
MESEMLKLGQVFRTVHFATGRTVKNESPMLLFRSGFDPHSMIFNPHRVAEGELYLVSDPLDVLKAFEKGIGNVVSFLTEGSRHSSLNSSHLSWTKRK